MELASNASEQAGVFSRAQAYAAGYSSWQVKRRLDKGEWIAVQRGVYAAASIALDGHSRLWAAYLAGGTGVTVSHLSAAAIHGLRPIPSDPWITVPPRRHVELERAHVIRADVGDDDVEFTGYLLLTGRERTVVDCLCVLAPDAALELLDRALQQRWITTEVLAARVRGRVGRRGVPQLRRLLRYATSDARFEAERRLHALLRRAGIDGWRGNVEVRDGSGRPVAIVDVLFPKLRLVIEVDGRAWHSAGERFQRDRVRQNALVAAGYVVLRFTWYDIVERPDYVVRTVRQMLDHLA